MLRENNSRTALKDSQQQDEFSNDSELSCLNELVVVTPPRFLRFSDLLDSVKGGEFKTFVLESLLFLTGSTENVDGLGFSLESLEKLSAGDKETLVSTLHEIRQENVHWWDRLQMAAIQTHIAMEQRGLNSSCPVDFVSHLKANVQPGDFVFFAQGEGVDVYSDFFEHYQKWIFSEEPGDELFPFAHVGIALDSEHVLHITPQAVKIRSWDRLLVEKTKFDGIAIARLNLPRELRDELPELARLSTEGRQYNMSWIFTDAYRFPWGSGNGPIEDRSYTDDNMVCLDVVTEPVKALAEKGVPISQDMIDAYSPLTILKARDISVVVATALRRA